MPSISYAITACNEHVELKHLLETIIPFVRSEDEIVLLLDSENKTDEVWQIAQSYNVGSAFQYHRILHPLNKDFAQFKNFLKQHCSKDYIFFIDADEYPSEPLISYLPQILENNAVDVMLIPRINMVEGITVSDIRKWGWKVDDDVHINWPDFQWRICRNIPEIKWEGKVHERLMGYKTLSQLPYDNKEYCLVHPKQIDRQRKQNEFYGTI
jgi:glycosyltransferase involved in cell wall biosynthesis